MRIHDIITAVVCEDVGPVSGLCSNFIEQSQGLPLYRNLPTNYKDVHRVKVRTRKGKGTLDTTFNEAFEAEVSHIYRKSVFTNGDVYELEESSELEPFYVFPINGFKFLYSKEVKHSSSDYKQVFESIFTELGEDKGQQVLTEMLRFTYHRTNLVEGIESGAEIILYNIPYFIAVRVDTSPSYSTLLN